MFLRGWRRLSTGTARAVAAVALAVQAESEEEGAGGGQRSEVSHTRDDQTKALTFSAALRRLTQY